MHKGKAFHFHFFAIIQALKPKHSFFVAVEELLKNKYMHNLYEQGPN